MVSQYMIRTPTNKKLDSNSTHFSIPSLSLEEAAGHLSKSTYSTDHISTANSWKAATKSFCSEHHITVDEKCSDLCVKRVSDAMIMGACFIDFGFFSLVNLCATNQSCLYSHITPLSDIATGDGHCATSFALTSTGYNHSIHCLVGEGQDKWSWCIHLNKPVYDDHDMPLLK